MRVPDDVRSGSVEVVATFDTGPLVGMLEARRTLRVLVALGKGAHDQILRALTVRPAGAYPFIHGRLHKLPTGLLLADSYHCSRYNTNTGRLTTEMFHDVFEGVKKVLAA